MSNTFAAWANAAIRSFIGRRRRFRLTMRGEIMSIAEAGPTRVLPRMPELTPEQIASYHTHGFLRIENMFTPAETDELSEHLNWLIDEWAIKDAGWTGPWRQKY